MPSLKEQIEELVARELDEDEFYDCLDEIIDSK